MKGWTVPVSLAVVAGGLSWTLGASAAGVPPRAPRHGGTLVLATVSPPRTLDPATDWDIVSIQFGYLMFQNLVTYAPNSSRIVPQLATRWKVSDGGRTWTFWLRHGVTFSNGDPLTAQDVVFTFTRLCEAKTASPYVGNYVNIVGGPQLYAGKAKSLSGIQAVGPYTVVMHLIQPQAYWLNVLALPSAAIEDPKVAADYAQHPVGTGPFILQSYVIGSQYVFVRNPHYWDAPYPYLNRIVIKIGPTPINQVLGFERGIYSALPFYLTGGLPPAQYLQVIHSPFKSDYIKAPEVTIEYIGMKDQTPPFNNPALREAIASAINKESILRIVYNNRGVVANSVLPPGMPGYDPALDPYPYNPARAKELLRQAGYPHGLTVTYAFVAEPIFQEIANVVVTDLSAIGIKVIERPMAHPVFNAEVVKPHAIPFFGFQWLEDYPDPQDFMYNLFDSQAIGGTNTFAYSNPQVDRQIQTADAILSMPQRLKLYLAAERTVLDQAVIVPTIFPEADALIAPQVQPHTWWIWLNPVLPAQLDKVWLK